MTWGRGARAERNAVRQLSGDFGSGRKDEVKKEIRLRAGGKSTRRFALPGGLQTFGNRSGVERIEGDAAAQDFDLFDSNRSAREVGHPQFVDQVSPAVRSGEWDRGILHCEQEGRYGLFGLRQAWGRVTKEEDQG